MSGDPRSGLEDVAQQVLDRVRRSAPGSETEIYAVRGAERAIEWKEKRLERVEESEFEGVGLRILQDGKQGFAWASATDPSSAERLVETALIQLPFSGADESRALPGPAEDQALPDLDLAASLWSETLFDRPLEESAPVMERVDAAAKAAHGAVRRTLEIGYSESRSETLILNSRGIRARMREGLAGLSAMAVAEGSVQTQIGSAGWSARQSETLDPERVGHEAGIRAGMLIGAAKPAPGEKAVLFDPWVAEDLLEMVESALCADEIQRGKSMLAGKRGKRVASEHVTLTDDPRLPGGIGSALFDDEGLPTRTKTMVEKGILKEFFYDAATGQRERRPSNASAGRGSFRSLPGPTGFNFFLEPGAWKREDLIADTRDGVLVWEIMGMHTADPVSGEFSVGISGLRVRNGEIEGGFRNAMVSGNILDVLASVDAVADDLRRYSSTCAPTFRVQGLSVA